MICYRFHCGFYGGLWLAEAVFRVEDSGFRIGGFFGGQ